LISGQDPDQVAFVVDDILGEEEGIVKDLTPLFGSLRHISGALILGSGKIVPVVDIPELIKTAMNRKEKFSGEEILNRLQTSKPVLPKVLVAEDSLTARSLMRNILESSGFEVKTAVDGAEAWQFLQESSYDLVVSDVEMPRMNGFDLTATIRSNAEIRDIPVILVTALETADDRRRGMEAGANAYINKSSFEQNHLIETINRLL